MLEIKTLKVSEYRGIRIYVRRLYGETFEYLIPWDNQIFQNQVELNKEKGQRLRPYTAEELENAVAFMKYTAEMFIEDKLFEQEIHDRFLNKLGRLKGRALEDYKHLKKKLNEIRKMRWFAR